MLCGCITLASGLRIMDKDGERIVDEGREGVHNISPCGLCTYLWSNNPCIVVMLKVQSPNRYGQCLYHIGKWPENCGQGWGENCGWGGGKGFVIYPPQPFVPACGQNNPCSVIMITVQSPDLSVVWSYHIDKWSKNYHRCLYCQYFEVSGRYVLRQLDMISRHG